MSTQMIKRSALATAIANSNFPKQAASPLADPYVRVLTGLGLGSLIGGTMGYNNKNFPMRTQPERVQSALAGAFKGGLLGAGAGMVPTAIEAIIGKA
jgi:hypothetical protein